MNASKVAEICSSTHPPTITSEGNSLTIAITVERDFSFMFDITAYYTVIDNGKFIPIARYINKFSLRKFLYITQNAEVNSRHYQVKLVRLIDLIKSKRRNKLMCCSCFQKYN